MDKDQDTQSVIFFLSPADVRNTAFLTYDYDDSEKDDDQWLYLPALKKNKRIASSDKSSSLIEMKTTKDKNTLHSTLLKLDDVKFNQDLDDDFFSVRRIEKEI